ncbi:hypothetical protein BGW39_008497 [Mortierella sp. 14UC]|nr:hypothetical protein BGW39_008497 [Mortierella sp. 14UC]
MTTAQQRVSEIPVLISGGGPVGTMAAIILTRLGVPCRLIERDTIISPLSKAFSLHARTLEIFEQTGVLDQFLVQGHPISHFDIYFNNVHSVFPGLVNSISHFNYALFLEQRKTTAILNDELEKSGLKVDRGWELMDTRVAVDDKDGREYVETTIRRALDGTNARTTESTVLGTVELEAEQAGKQYETQVVRSQYLIAADGGKSVVRHKVGIPFVGRTLENTVILYEGLVETDFKLSDITVINGSNNKTMNIFPLSNGQVRVMIDATGELDPTQELTLEAFTKLAQAAAYPTRFDVKSQTWLTYYKVNERQAASYSHKNRIFLAGDAAHVHSPAGGQGMNLGLQDAHNLTWKMALVIHGLADPKILETYEQERGPVAKAVIKMSSNMFAMGFSNSLAYRAIRKTVTTFISLFVGLIAVPAGTVSMLANRYDANSINQTHKIQPLPKEAFQVGQRAHDGPLHRVLSGGKKSETETRLHQLLYGPGNFHILVFTSDLLSVTSASKGKDKNGTPITNETELRENVEKYLAQWRSKWSYGKKLAGKSMTTTPNATATTIMTTTKPIFHVHLIAALPETLSATDFKDPTKIYADSFANKEIGEGALFLDDAGTSIVHQRYGVTPVKAGAGAIVVVRPDSHLGYRVLGAGPAAWDDVDQYLHSILS